MLARRVGIRPFEIQEYCFGSLIITALATPVKSSIRQLVLDPIQGNWARGDPKVISPPRQPTVWTLSTAMQECPCVLVIIRQTQLLETKWWGRQKWNIESYDARSISLKVVPSHSEIIIVQENVGCLPVCKQEEFLFLLCSGRQWLVQKSIKCFKKFVLSIKILWTMSCLGTVLNIGIQYLINIIKA